MPQRANRISVISRAQESNMLGRGITGSGVIIKKTILVGPYKVFEEYLQCNLCNCDS